MAIRVVEFSNGGYKIRKIFAKESTYPMKLLNFEFWINGELSKIGHHFGQKVIYKSILSKNVSNEKCAPILVFFNEKKIEKYLDDF